MNGEQIKPGIRFCLAVACAMVGGLACLGARSLVDLPVSAVENRAYLQDLPTRPWWNGAWSRRAPILIANRAIEPSDKAVIDAVVDFGESVNSDEVRVVTPWGVEIPCVCEKEEGTAVRLLFQTELRIEENRPFFVYWGNPQAKKAKVRSLMSLDVAEDEVRLNNGVLDVVFDNRHLTGGLLKTLRVVGSSSRNELLERATGYAWEGFNPTVGGVPKWGSAKVIWNNAFKKQIRFESDKIDVDFFLYSEQPRLDYAYRLKDGNTQLCLGISWACGGGTAFDELVYPCLTGKMRKLLAGLNNVSDNIPTPRYDLMPWLSEGWYAISDRRTGNVVGHLFDRMSLKAFDYNGAGQSAGELASLAFAHAQGRDVAKTGSGALYASIGKAEDVRREYRRLNGHPTVLVGKTEVCTEHPVRIPRLDRDFCMDFNIGKNSGAGWASGEPLEGMSWCSNICERLQSYGANVVRIGGYTWQDLPTTKDIYDRYRALCRSEYANKPDRKIPDWKEGACTGQKFREHCDVAHAKGMAVSLWSGLVMPGWHFHFDVIFDPEVVDLETDYALLYARTGADVIYNGILHSESPLMPDAMEKANGKTYWTWKNPRDYFRAQDRRNELQKRLYRRAKASGVDKPVMTLHSEDGELWREMFGAGMAGSVDSIYCEMMPVCDNPTLIAHVKHVTKRLRASWNNKPGHTVHNHFYYMNYDYANRIQELEVPFITGINGFSFENLTYENFSREASQITADFYRFASYTRLGEKVAKMGPVKNLAVFRDSRAFEEDIVAGRNKDPYPYQARQDGRVNSFAEIHGFNYDVVIEKYFTAKDLAPYKAVYIPEDVALSKELADELVAYVKAGGGAIVEGETVGGAGAGCQTLAKLGLKDGVVTNLGKGKIVWIKGILTDRIAKRERKAWQEAKNLVASVGGIDPLQIESRTIDGVLQSGDDGMFLGVYNKGRKVDTGRVKIAEAVSGKSENTSALYVLDVRRGVRFAYTNGFEIALGPEQCGFYLIGDDKFTALPNAVGGTWTGARLASLAPSGILPKKTVKGDFKQAKAIEIVATKNGKPIALSRSEKAAIDVLSITEDGYNARQVAKVLDTAAYVHIQADASVSDLVFADCADQLKMLLKRGGTILFDKSAPGPKARAFLKDIDVFNPFSAITQEVLDQEGEWNATVPTNSVLCVRKRSFKGLHCGEYSFARWDAEHQYAPYVLKRNHKVAQMIVQEKVLGSGKIIFDCHARAFNDFYENRHLGDAILSYMIGMPVGDHAKKVELANGGPGEELSDCR